MCLSMLDNGAPNVQRHFIYVTIKEEKRSEEGDDFNGTQQGVAFEGKVFPEAPVWPLMKWKVFSSCPKFISIRNVTSPEGNFLFLGSVTVPVSAIMEAVQVTLPCHCNTCFSHPFSVEVEAKCVNGVTISSSCFPYSSAPWHSLYLRSNSGCQHSWDKYIRSTLISFAVSVGCGIIHFLSRIDCSFAFSCQTTVSFYIRGSHISLLGKIIHGDTNKACGSNRITYFGNRNSLISPVNKRPHGVCAVLSFE